MTYREVEMPCPECGIALQQYAGRDKWRCSSCSGLLIGASEQVEVSAWKHTPAEPRRCPRCTQEMFPIDLDPLVLDRCGACELFWFDRGELAKLREMTAEKLDGWDVYWANFVRTAL